MFWNKFKFVQPPCMMCGAQGPVDRRIIMMLVIGLIIITGLYISDYRIKPWNIICQTEDSIIVKNNIQATHTYNYSGLKAKDTGVYLSGIDDWGDLWGSSMQPTFFEGNTVLLKNFTNSTSLKTGDIIRYFRYTNKYPDCISISEAIANNSLGGAYVENNMATIHRINAVYDDIIVVQGDNLNEQETIDRCQITDIVVGIIFT